MRAAAPISILNRLCAEQGIADLNAASDALQRALALEGAAILRRQQRAPHKPKPDIKKIVAGDFE
ncbi:hypothetical protein [Parvibium lacunae]|uniref:Uncharacterized protein n=1 Tax=Parvibium lacunae TaxID=1888893 RepID=A0A368L7U2_9BURK|nr:hypothetical protein [Parvibium lacunae]RCS59740.1 hypothetical protein DU000_03255 [Parvibium lacunae]